MNDKITDYMMQAELYSLSVCGFTAHSDYHKIRDNKFAELIVGECSTALNPMLRDMISRGQAVDLIKQHFGIKDER